MDSLLDLFFANADPKNWSTPARTLIESLQGVTNPITETHFDPEELEFIKTLIKQKGAKSGNITYKDYVEWAKKQESGSVNSFGPGLASLFDPYGRIQTTLGQFRYAPDKLGNMQVTDMYDFNPMGPKNLRGPGELNNTVWDVASGPYGILRNYAGSKLPVGTGRKVNINLGKF